MLNKFEVDSRIADILEKSLSGDELSLRDGIELMESEDIFLTGYVAHTLKLRKFDRMVTFTVNRHINYTNICVSKCKLCAYFKDPESPTAFTLSIEDIIKKIEESVPLGIKEVHIVGGLNPDLTIEYFEKMFFEIKNRFPSISIKALTAVEVDFLAKHDKTSLREVLSRLKAAGLEFMPGGGAEIFNPEIRQNICSGKISGERWLKVMEEAHKLGIRTNATILYGHIESPRDRVEHLIQLRELQKKTGGFQALIPLSFHPTNTKLQKEGFVKNRVSSLEDLKMMAVSRLLLHNTIPNIRAYWVMLGKRLAQVSLHFGVNDLEGTVVEEKITHAAGATTDEFMTKEELINLIRDANMIPAERTTDYRVLRVYEQP